MGTTLTAKNREDMGLLSLIRVQTEFNIVLSRCLFQARLLLPLTSDSEEGDGFAQRISSSLLSGKSAMQGHAGDRKGRVRADILRAPERRRMGSSPLALCRRATDTLDGCSMSE